MALALFRALSRLASSGLHTMPKALMLVLLVTHLIAATAATAEQQHQGMTLRRSRVRDIPSKIGGEGADLVAASNTLSHLSIRAAAANVTDLYRRQTASTAPKGVFAHFMVENAVKWSQQQWQDDMQLAKEAGIDAFAMNFGASLDTSVFNTAFAAANAVKFSLFFSFDYAGAGPFEKSLVLYMLNTYAGDFWYYRYRGKPLVSTFEGPANAKDWVEIKKQYSCFFIPDWSSLGAKAALELESGVADGLFSWAAWPWGNTDSDTYVDASYLDYLAQAGKKPYMMPVSPWFYTNLPGYKKNWLWRGDDLWRDRWEQVMVVQPDFVQVVTWNDYGESSHIGPLRDIDNYGAFSVGRAPFNYAKGLPHDGWRLFLPWWTELYRNGIAAVKKEGIVAWNRPNPKAVCSDGGTTGNTASQLLIEFKPADVVQDKIFFSALLGSDATVTVKVGDVSIPAQWKNKPFEGIGVYHGSVEYGNNKGNVVVSVARNGKTFAVATGPYITGICTNGYNNWNAIVGSGTGPDIASKVPSLKIANQTCIRGTAPGNFKELCEFTCQYGYCPIGACRCLELGKQATLPKSTGVKGYPAKGLGSSYIGLCNFACNLGKCPESACSTQQHPLVEPTVSPFLPPACTGGTGPGALQGLCSYGCGYGFCPMQNCTCTSTGALNRPPAADSTKLGTYQDGVKDNGLCEFACTRTYCPSPPCTSFNSDLICGLDDTRAECHDPTFDNFPPLDCSKTYSSLDDIPDGVDSECATKYILETLATMVENDLKTYQDILAQGYSSKFVTYANAVVKAAPKTMSDFYAKYGDRFFDCDVMEWILCCNNCDKGRKNDCKYCRNSNCQSDSSGDLIFEKRRQTCPPNNSERGWVYNEVGAQGVSIHWMFKSDAKKAEFYSFLKDETGINQGDTGIGDVDHRINGGCTGGSGDDQGGPIDCKQYNHGWDFNVPVITKGYTKEDVADPKDTIANLLNQAKFLPRDLRKAAAGCNTLAYTSYNEGDLIQVATLPVLMIRQAIKSMQNVVNTANEIKEAELKKFITIFISVLLFLIPIGGQAIGTINGLATVGRIVALSGEAGALAFDIYGVVDDKESAPFLAFGALASLGGIADAAKIGKAASVQRAMTDVQSKKLGEVVLNGMGKVAKIRGTCRRG